VTCAAGRPNGSVELGPLARLPEDAAAALAKEAAAVERFFA